MRQVVRTHFIVDASPVSFDGLGTDSESRADVPAGKSFDDQIKNFSFSSGDPAEALFNIIKVFTDEIPVNVVVRGIGSRDESYEEN